MNMVEIERSVRPTSGHTRGAVGDPRTLCDGMEVLGGRIVMAPSRHPLAISANGIPLRGAKGDNGLSGKPLLFGEGAFELVGNLQAQGG